MSRPQVKVRDERDQVAIAKVYEADQGHVFQFWEELDSKERRALLDQLALIDFQALEKILGDGEARATGALEPAPDAVLRAPQDDAERARDEQAIEAGREALARGQVAGVMVAGGQGTRLGYDGPKGAFPIGPVTERSLFQLFAEHALAAARRHKSSFPLYVMTSPQNHDATVAIFKERGSFGMSAGDVFFFKQREMPAVDRRGKLLLAERGRIATSPDGHGGVVHALAASGALADMARRGIEYLSYWQVDNPLVPIADPLFVGYLITRDAEAAAKVVSKRGPEEKVGVFGRVGGHLAVIEYTELPKEEAERRDASGRLVYDAGNIAIHAFRRTFLERVVKEADTLPYHKAKKKVPFVDREGTHVEPTEPNALKLERFIFDIFPAARGVVLRDVRREEEFAPVKNDVGEDSPETSRRALSNLYGSWLEAAGATVARDASGNVAVPIEISPLVAQSAEDLARKVEPGTRIDEAVRL